LIYELFIHPRIATNNPFTKSEDVHDTPKTENDETVQKKIDMSKVEDADYKEID
jgi:hypothetical protein